MENLIQKITDVIQASASIKQKMAADEAMKKTLLDVALVMSASLKGGGKVLFCGNGGSAADAQHLAAELSGRFYTDRDPLYSEALHVNTSYLTAVANDYSYDQVYSRLVKGQGRKGDVIVGISTSGNSGNIIKALEVARELGMITVGMTGETGGKMLPLCDFILRMPSKDTPRIQEGHILAGHIICELVEEMMFPQS